MDTNPAVSVDASPDADAALKRAFAAALLKHPPTLEGRFAAATSLTADVGKALVMANRWLDDPAVLAEQTRLNGPLDEDPLNAVFTKQDLARLVWQRIQTTYDDDSFAKLVSEAAKLRGWNKPESQVNVQVNNNKVMIVRDLGSDDEWEAKARKQQRALIDVSASAH